LYAQTPPLPSFEVASIKSTAHGKGPDGVGRSWIDTPSPESVVAVNSSIMECITWAYRLKDYQLVAPDWLDAPDVSFDINAKGPPGTTKPQLRLMMQALLAERFKLKVHRETRTLPVYHLVVAKQGAKLREADSSPGWGTTTGGGRMEAHHVTMEQFAEALSREIGRPVFNQTEIAGAYDYKMSYAPMDSTNDMRQPIFSAIQQYGLRLESAKGPVEVVVVDHVEKKPTGN
jgi:uncharacterized protein (TIGR03435 family)